VTDRADLRARLDALEDRLAPADTSLVVVTGPADSDAYPAGVGPGDITNERTDPGVDGEPLVVEEPVVPIYRPPEYRGGVVTMTTQEVAEVFDSMPEQIRKKEREARIERGEPVPGVLAQ